MVCLRHGASAIAPTEYLDIPLLLTYGSGAYSVLVLALHPLSVLKTRMQASVAVTTMTAAFRQVLSQSGLRGLYVGVGPVLLGAIPARSSYILALEGTRPAAFAACDAVGVGGPAAAAASSAASGFAAVLCSQIVYVPTDVVTQRMMVGGDGAGSAAEVVDSVRRESGLRGLWRGFGVSLLAHLPAGTIWWAAYGGVREAAASRRSSTPLPELVERAAAATWAAFCAVGCTSPFDVLKVRAQLATSKRTPPLLHIFRELWREEGLRGFYRGFGPRWGHASLWGGCVIALYERLKVICTKPRESGGRALRPT